MKLIILFCLLSFSFQLNTRFLKHKSHLPREQNFVCNHDSLMKQYPPSKSFESQRFKQDDYNKFFDHKHHTIGPITFRFDYTLLNAGVSSDDIRIIRQSLKVAADYLKRRIKVIKPKKKLKYIRKPYTCQDVEIPKEYIETGISEDMLFMIKFTREKDAKYLARAGACYYDPNERNRPPYGMITYNLALLNSTSDFQRFTKTTLHEIIHALGFSSSAYEFYVDAGGKLLGIENVVESHKVRGIDGHRIITPTVVKIAQDFYNCPNIRGVELENDKTNEDEKKAEYPSHWEKTMFHNELMVSIDHKDSILSIFTFALLKDSGWYYINLEDAENFHFGENSGCDFIEKACKAEKKTDEFCYKKSVFFEDQRCDYQNNFFGMCSTSTYSKIDDCMFVEGGGHDCQSVDDTSNSKTDIFGLKSKCIEIGEIPHCLEIKCMEGKIQFKSKLSDEWAVCNRKDEEVEGGIIGIEGKIKCPDPIKYCRDYYPNCPNSCSNKGKCIKGKCECRLNYRGVSCSEKLKVTGLSDSCPGHCSHRGQCRNDICECPPNYEGLACQHRVLDHCKSKADCNGNFCNNGKCMCPNPKSGSKCALKTCPRGFCKNNGYCDEIKGNKCICTPQYEGDRCEKKVCFGNCSGKGKCNEIDGTCTCEKNYGGHQCERFCKNNCNNNGDCVDGLCQCRGKFSGEECLNVEACSTFEDCGKRGNCIKQKCSCFGGFSGKNCEKFECLEKCLNGGRCVVKNIPSINILYGIETPVCECKNGWYGRTCNSNIPPKTCPNECNLVGKCKPDKTCFCNFVGFTQPDCGKSESCTKNLNNCNGHGECLGNVCSCDDGYIGKDCSIKETTKLEMTYCLNGIFVDIPPNSYSCYCIHGWEGSFCEKQKK